MRRIDLNGVRPRYETPAVKDLGALDVAEGACLNGAAATGNCSSGGSNVVGNDCATGGVNTGSRACRTGSTNTGTDGCRTGSTAAAGACLSGSYPV